MASRQHARARCRPPDVDQPRGLGQSRDGATRSGCCGRPALRCSSIGSLDFGLQKWRLHTSLKMTKQELKDEARSGEGNPEIKARVRRIQREMFRKRMLQAVPRATVVLTNPTHFAVALEYTRDKIAAPGRHRQGRRSHRREDPRNRPRPFGVPIVENPPLARALFKECEVGDVIPGPLFGAVAEVLAYLVRIKQLVL